MNHCAHMATYWLYMMYRQEQQKLFAAATDSCNTHFMYWWMSS